MDGFTRNRQLFHIKVYEKECINSVAFSHCQWSSFGDTRVTSVYVHLTLKLAQLRKAEIPFCFFPKSKDLSEESTMGCSCFSFWVPFGIFLWMPKMKRFIAAE